MAQKTFNIETQEKEVIGTVSIDEANIDTFDFALTPIVTVTPDKDREGWKEPEVQGFLASPRTQLDPRPRSTEPPYDHIEVEVETPSGSKSTVSISPVDEGEEFPSS